MEVGISIAVLRIVLMIALCRESPLRRSGEAENGGGGVCSTYPYCILLGWEGDFRLCLMDRHLGVCSHPNIVIISETTTMAGVEGSLKDQG